MNDTSINAVMNLQAANLGVQLAVALVEKGKEVGEQQAEGIIQLIEELPAPEDRSGHNVNIKV